MLFWTPTDRSTFKYKDVNRGLLLTFFVTSPIGMIIVFNFEHIFISFAIGNSLHSRIFEVSEDFFNNFYILMKKVFCKVSHEYYGKSNVKSCFNYWKYPKFDYLLIFLSFYYCHLSFSLRLYDNKFFYRFVG